jgi:hypothetical protein
MATRLTANTVAHPNPLPMGEGAQLRWGYNQAELHRAMVGPATCIR